MSKKLLREDNNFVSGAWVCPVPWGNWSTCTKTCGKGTTTRLKHMNGQKCGNVEGTCNDFECDGKCMHYFIYSRLAYRNGIQRIVVGITFLRLSNYSCGSHE